MQGRHGALVHLRDVPMDRWLLIKWTFLKQVISWNPPQRPFGSGRHRQRVEVCPKGRPAPGDCQLTGHISAGPAAAGWAGLRGSCACRAATRPPLICRKKRTPPCWPPSFGASGLRSCTQLHCASGHSAWPAACFGV